MRITSAVHAWPQICADAADPLMAASLSAALRMRVRRAAAERCGYCRTSQASVPWRLEIDPIIPRACGVSDGEDNLWLACRACYLFTGYQTHARAPLAGRRVRLYHPRRQHWRRHFQWSPDGTMILGRTVTGRATVAALSLNNLVVVTVRRNWITAGWHPPRD
jgi:hypothetical protein